MDFNFTDAQRDLAALTRSLLAADRSLAQAGVFAAALPKSVGGDGYGLPEQCSVLVELGRAASPVPYLDSVVVAASALAECGDERWAPAAARGDIVLTAALD